MASQNQENELTAQLQQLQSANGHLHQAGSQQIGALHEDQAKTNERAIEAERTLQAQMTLTSQQDAAIRRLQAEFAERMQEASHQVNELQIQQQQQSQQQHQQQLKLQNVPQFEADLMKQISDLQNQKRQMEMIVEQTNQAINKSAAYSLSETAQLIERLKRVESAEMQQSEMSRRLRTETQQQLLEITDLHTDVNKHQKQLPKQQQQLQQQHRQLWTLKQQQQPHQ